MTPLDISTDAFRCRVPRPILHLLWVAVCWLAALPAWGHIGSPNILFSGNAGPYDVRVVVRPPAVIPGLAQISVRVGGEDIRHVTVRPVHYEVGLEGSPPPDPAEPVPGDPGHYSAELWLMTQGSYSVYVDIEGGAGHGSAAVPITSVATGRPEMNQGLGALLLLLGALLFAGGVTAVGAATGQSITPPDESPSAGLRRRGHIAMAATAAVLALALYGGKQWWDSEEQQHINRLFRPLEAEAEISIAEGRRSLRLTLVDNRWLRGRFSPFVPDHGKLMHMFLIREPDLDAFAHVHPVPDDDGNHFDLVLPPLPAGTYRAYADVTHESGYAQTITATFDLPAAPTPAEVAAEGGPDPDDSWRLAEGSTDDRHVFTDGMVMERQAGEPLTEGRPISLSFVLRDPAGEAAPLEPYMGMLAHGVVRRHDGSVFVHLHPTGTISMAAQQLFEQKQGATSAHEGHEMHMGEMGHGSTGPITLPYEFPQPGPYRIWVQVKSAGTVYTGVFDIEVAPAPAA